MNPQMLEDVYNASQRSQGSAQRELSTYLDSIEAKFAKLQNRLQELAYTSIDSDFIKTIVDGLTKAVELATKLVDTVGVLPTILGSIAGFVSFKQKRTIFDMIPGIKDIKKMIQSNNLPSINDIKLSSYQQAIDGVTDLFPDNNPNFDIDFSLSGVETAQASLSDFKYEVVDTFDVAQESALDAGAIIGNFGSSFSGLISGVKAFGVAFGKAFISMAAITLATKAIQMAASALHDFIHRDEIMIQNGKEATEAITERSKAFEEYKDQLGKIESEATGLPESKTSEESIKKIAREYDKLHDKVNAGTNENESLSTDDYERYLELSNNIAKQFPSLVKGWDSQGNAILNLGSSADTAEDAIMRLYEAERRAANVEIAGNLQASYDGFAKQIEQKEAELKGLQNKLDGLNSKTAQNEEMPGGISSLDDLDFNSNIIQTSSVEAENNLRKAFNSVNQSYGLVLSNITSDIDGLNQTFQVQGFELLTPDQQSAFRESLKTALQSGIESQGIQLAEEITNQMGQINAAELFIQDQKKNITSTIGDYLSTSDIFAKQSAAFQDAFLANIGNLDISKLMGDAYSGDIMSFMYGEIIEPLYKLQPEAQAAIDGLFKLDPEKTSVWKYIDTVQKQLTAAFGGDEKLASEWRQKLGFDQIIQDITDAQLDISNEFKDQSGKILEDSGFDPSVLATQTLSDLKLYADLVRTHSYETWEQLQEDFKKQRERVYKTDKTRTLADVLSDETFKSDVDYANYEGNLSSLTSALETLRTEGQLTAETLVSLQKSIPSLTDFSEDSLKDTAFKQLDAWIQRIREEMTTMSEEGKEQARTMIANMVNQYGDLDLVASDVANAYVKERGHIGQEAAVDRAEYDRKVKELQESLGDEELDYHVLYTLVASDQFSGTAEEIYNAYNNAELQWHLILDNKELEKQVQIAQQNLSAEESLRSLKEAKGETLTESDYDESLRFASEIQDALYQEAENAKTERDKINKDINPDTWGAANISYINALAAARDAEAKVAQLQKEQIDASLNGLRNAVTDADNEVTKAQNAITKAEENVGEGMADQKLYDTLAAALLLRSLANTNLSDAQQKLYDTYKDTAPELAQGYLSDSFSSASSAQNDSKEANAQKNIQYQRNLNLLQEDATRIQRDLTMAERDHQHTSQMTYRDLIDNGRAQIENLRAQQDLVKDDISSWRNYQDQIEQMEDSIYDWSATMEQALSTSTADQMSTGFITEEQLNALKSAGVDYSDMLEVGAKGWKLNTDKVNEYEDALRAVQVAQSKQIESDAKDRATAIDKEMKALLGESSDQAKIAEEAGKNAANNFVSGMSEGLSTARQGGLQALENLESGIDKADISERIKAGIDAQGLLDEGYFQDLAEAQSYLDLSGAREELEATIQAQQEYQIATAASIDIAKQFSEASSAANDRDLAETVSGGVKGALETKNKGWWGDKNLQQYAKFFADKDTPLYKALDEFESSWNNVWSKYYGSDGEITDDGVQQFIQDSVGKGLTLDSEIGEDGYTFDWLLKDVDIDELATQWDTSKENIISLLSAFEDTRSWQQVDWSSIFGGAEEISSSTDAMSEYINNLEILQKYNPDMDMGQYFQTAASGLTKLQNEGADSKEIQEFVNQLNQLAELTGQDYKITITEDGNFDVVDTKLQEMHEKIDTINKSSIRINNGKVEVLDDQTQQQLQELADYANGDGKELMLSWGFKPNADGEFTPQDLAKQIITFNWKFAEDPVDKPNQKNDTFTRAPIKKGPKGENLTGAVEYTDSGTGWHELTTEETPVDPMEALQTGQDNIQSTVSTGFSDATSKLGDLNVTAEQIAANTAKPEVPSEGSESSETLQNNDPFNYGNGQGYDRTQNGRITLNEPKESTPQVPLVADSEVQKSAERYYRETNGITEDLPLVADTFGIGQSTETVAINAQNVQVNDDTNTPGTLANGESLTPEQRQEYSSTPETPEGEAYEGEGGTETGTAVINADVAELNAGLPNETDPNYTPPVEESSYQFMNPSNPFEYGQPQPLQYQESWQPPTPTETTTPSEVSTGDMSVNAGNVTISGPVEIPKTSTDTSQPSYTPAPTSTPSPTADASIDETSTKVTVEADVTPAEEAIAGLGETPVTVGVDIEAPQTEEFQTVLDRVGNLGQQPVEIQLSTQDNATEDLQNVEDKANDVAATDPVVNATTQDNASGDLQGIIDIAGTVDSQTPIVNATTQDDASGPLQDIVDLAGDVEGSDPTVNVGINDGGALSTLMAIRTEMINMPLNKEINITTHYHTDGARPDFASGTFHPAHALGTVYGYASGTIGKYWDEYSRQNSLGAYAGGRNVALGHDQDALVNEVGVESIVRGGQWMLMPGGNGVHVESLKRGDIVFNASQTKDLIEHGKASGRGKVAYASGTAKSPMPALVKATEEPRKVKTGNPKIVKSTNGKGYVEIVDDNNWVDKVTSAVTRMGQEISQALDTPDDNTDTWSDDYAQIRLLNDQSAAIQANTAATQNNTKVKNQEATYVDFAEKVMNRLSKATARLQNRITEFTTYTFKKNTLRAELDSLADEIAATSAALPVYAEYLQMLRNTPIQHESSSDGGGGGGSDSGSDSDAEDTTETNAEEAATRLETAKSNLKAAKQNLKDNYKLSDEQKKKIKNNKKIDDSEIKGSNKKNAAQVYNDALKQYKQLKKQEDTATETTAKETSKAAKNTEQNTAEVAQTSSQTASHTGAVVSSAEAVEASGYDIASYTELGAAAGTDTVTILQTISGQIAGLSTQIADISVNVNIDGGSASVSSGGGGSKSSGSSDDDDGGSGGSKNGKDVDDYSWSKKNQEAIENGEKIDISTIDPSKKNKIAAAKAYNKSLKNGGGSSSSSGSSNKSSGSSNKSSSGNVKSKSGDGGVSVSSGSGKGHTASAEEKQFKKEMKAAAKDVKNSYTLTSDQQKAIKKGETLSTKGITDQTKKDAFKTYNQAVKKYNNARLSTSVSSNAPISPNNDPLHNENMRALSLVEAAQAKAGKGGGGGGGGGGSIGGIDPSSVPASSSDKAAESIYDTLNGDYLGEFANILEDNDLIAILGLDKDLASALEEYDEFLNKLEDTKDSLEQLYQQVVSVWDELAQAPLEEADRQIEQLELGIDGLTAALGRLDSAMAGGSTLNVLDTIRETEKAAADYTATSQAVLDAIRDANADKTDNAARQVEIRRWAVDEAKQVLEDAQKAMDEVTRDADEKIAEYKKTREETEKKLAEAQATATSTAAAVSSLEQNEYVKRYKEIEAKKALAPTGGIFSKLLGIKETEPRQNGFLSDDMPSSPYASILTGLGARQNSNDPLKRIFGFNSGADSVIEQYTEAVKKAGEATAEVTAQQSALRESTLLLAQAELDKTLREEMQAEILQQAKLAYDQAQTALAQAESEYAAQYIQEVVDNFGAVEEAFESVLRYQKALDENEELYVKNAEERGNRITAAMRQFQSGNLLGQTATLRAEIAALNEELSGDRLVYGSKEWNDLMSQILDKETELNDLLNQQHGILLSILSDVKEHYSVLIDHLEQVNKLNDAWIDTARAIGDYETELSYIQRYAEQQEMVALYLQQSADAQEQFNNLVARGELIAGTDEYIAKQTEVLSLINDAKNAQNDLREIEADRIKYTIERYEELLDRVDNYVDIIKALGGLISEAAKFDYKTGNLTDMGQASIAIEMTAWQENTEQLRDVLEERQRLRDEFARNPDFGEKEFAEALDANDKQIQEYLSNIKGAADNIVEIGITIAEKQLAAINKTIDARRKALQLEQDYYNYDKQLKNSTKDIELLNAQIRALDGVTDAESRAMKARLEAQRQDLQDQLDDTVREHVVNLQTEGLTEMQEQLADNLDEWRNELQGDIQKQLDYINSINMSASNIEAALNKLVLGASNGVATLSDVETAVKENGLLTSTVSDVNKQYEEGHAKAVATKQAQDAGAELAARIQGAINTLGTSVSTANIDKFTKEWAAVADKANYNIGSTDQTGKDIQALINQLKSDVSQNQSMKNWVDAIAAVKSPTYNYSQAQIDAMAKSGNVAKQGYSSVITNAKAVWDKMSAEQKKAYNEVAGAFHAGKTVDQMLATYTNAVDSLNKAVATNVEKAKAEMARKAAEEAKRKAEEEAKRRAAEEAARKKAEEEARKKAEEAAKKKAEEEAKKKAEEEAKQKDPRYRLMGIYNGGGGSYDGPGYSEMLYGVQSVAASTSTNASSEKVYVLTPKANDYILKEGEVLVDQKKTKKKATGTRHAQKGMTLTQEKGGEIITTKDGVLVPLKAGDGVIPANLTDKLFRMAMDYPNIGQTIALPEMKPAQTNVTVSYGSLLTVNGNVDKDALPGLQDILKQAYQYTSKQLAIDAKKAGMRQARY